MPNVGFEDIPNQLPHKILDPQEQTRTQSFVYGLQAHIFNENVLKNSAVSKCTILILLWSFPFIPVNFHEITFREIFSRDERQSLKRALKSTDPIYKLHQVWFSMVQCGMVQCGMVQYIVYQSSIKCGVNSQRNLCHFFGSQRVF